MRVYHRTDVLADGVAAYVHQNLARRLLERANHLAGLEVDAHVIVFDGILKRHARRLDVDNVAGPGARVAAGADYQVLLFDLATVENEVSSSGLFRIHCKYPLKP